MATSYADYVDEYDATCSYDVDNDASLCRRFIAAVRGMLRFASESRRDGVSMANDPEILQAELARALAWLASNDPSTSNPSVVHADFSGFGQYGGSYQ